MSHAQSDLPDRPFSILLRSGSYPKERAPRQFSIRRIEDVQYPRGHRKLCSSAKMRKLLLNMKIATEAGKCAICRPVSRISPPFVGARFPAGCALFRIDTKKHSPPTRPRTEGMPLPSSPVSQCSFRKKSPRATGWPNARGITRHAALRPDRPQPRGGPADSSQAPRKPPGSTAP